MRTDSQQLLVDYVRTGSDAAFRELVSCYLDLVYSTALRLVNGDTHQAQDVAQVVFVDLARMAPDFSEGVLVGGWLHRHTCFVAAKALRGERRRQARERQAVEMNALQQSPDTSFTQVAPLLDETINQLGDDDRRAILLRFFEQSDFRSIAQVLGASEDAARMRVNRALEKLERLLRHRGVTTTAAALSPVLLANAVHAAPAELVATISTAALAGTASATVATITAKTIAMTMLQKTLVAVTVAAVAGMGVYQTHQASTLRGQIQTLREQQAAVAEQIGQLKRERDDALARLAGAPAGSGQLNEQTAELLKLRAENTRLRNESAARSGQTNDPLFSEAVSWKNRVTLLKQRLEQMPEARIPELQLVTDQDWLNAARDELKTDKDYRQALARLRSAGENKFAGQVQPALSKYMKANNDQFPTSLDQLQAYFESPVDPAILDRWAIVPASTLRSLSMGSDWVITQASAPDPEYDTRWGIGPNGYGNSGSFEHKRDTADILGPAMKAFYTANNGQVPSEPAQLEPYLTTDEQRTELAKVADRFKSMTDTDRAQMRKEVEKMLAH